MLKHSSRGKKKHTNINRRNKIAIAALEINNKKITHCPEIEGSFGISISILILNTDGLRISVQIDTYVRTRYDLKKNIFLGIHTCADSSI